MDNTDELLIAIHEIRDLLRLLAEPAIAERDKKSRTELRRLVGSSAAKAKALVLMDGTRSQSDITKETGIDQGQLSIFVKQLNLSKLLSGDGKKPRIIIAIPSTFFEAGGDL